MENIFETLAEITKPEPVKRYMVVTETKGTLYFDELPKKTYFLGGFRDPADKGKATYYMGDAGTCLIPIIDTITGKQVCIPSRAGQSI
jgi:hypothetical protein